MKYLRKYEHTIYASYIACITQAIVNNFAPLLFLTFAKNYHLTLDKITFLTTINFLVQLFVDLLSAKWIDRIGYRVSIVIGHIFSVIGLLGLAFFPIWFLNEYVGLLTAVVLYAIGGGLIEVLVSPIVEACPTKKKEAAMSLLHSFYCWGHVGVVLLSTLFFTYFGVEEWRILAVLWAFVPFINSIYFLVVPLYLINEKQKEGTICGLLKQPIFWLIIMLMICAGAAEQAMSQWASSFAESALQVSKTIGDLAGPCTFALLMGIARALYGKYSEQISLRLMMVGSAGLCIICYLLAVFAWNPIIALIGCAFCGFSVGIFWPGTFSMAAVRISGVGTAMYALMALAGDIGCSIGPTIVGLIANKNGDRLETGLIAALGFPIFILIGMRMLKQKERK